MGIMELLLLSRTRPICSCNLSIQDHLTDHPWLTHYWDAAIVPIVAQEAGRGLWKAFNRLIAPSTDVIAWPRECNSERRRGPQCHSVSSRKRDAPQGSAAAGVTGVLPAALPLAQPLFRARQTPLCRPSPASPQAWDEPIDMHQPTRASSSPCVPVSRVVSMANSTPFQQSDSSRAALTRLGRPEGTRCWPDQPGSQVWNLNGPCCTPGRSPWRPAASASSSRVTVLSSGMPVNSTRIH